MKLELFLIRHAKSCWSDPSIEDFSRGLNARGKEDLKIMRKQILKLIPKPDLILISPAKRTLKTAQKIIEKNEWDCQIDCLYLLYLAEVEVLLGIIKKIEDENKKVIIFGHNDGLTNFANFIQDKKIDNIPTLGTVQVSFNFNSWKKVKQNSGTLENYIYPKLFKK